MYAYCRLTVDVEHVASIQDYNECVVAVVSRAEWDLCVCVLSAYSRRRAGSSLRSLPALFARSLLLPNCVPCHVLH